MPITIYRGDNNPAEPITNPGQDAWRVRLSRARLWADAVSLAHLPRAGIHDNTHFPFSDLNNLQVADLLSGFLERKGLD